MLLAEYQVSIGRNDNVMYTKFTCIGGIDIGVIKMIITHAAAVHGLDIRFDYQPTFPEPGVMTYRLAGHVPDEGWRGRLLGLRAIQRRFEHRKIQQPHRVCGPNSDNL